MSIEVIEHDDITYAEVIWADARVEQTKFFSPPESSFQFGLLAHEAGYQRGRRTTTRRSSARSTTSSRCSSSSAGSSTFELYTDDGRIFREMRLRAGDAIVLIHGVHAIQRDRGLPGASASSRVRSSATRSTRSSRGRNRCVIPVFEPVIGEEEIEAVADARPRAARSPARSARTSRAFEREFAAYVGTRARRRGHERHDRACSSRSRRSASAPGDEVLVSASHEHRDRARRVPQRRTSQSGRLRAGDLEPRPRPGRGADHADARKAIMPVHLFGHPVDMDRLVRDRRPARPRRDRGLRRGPRRDRPRPDDRRFGDMGCFSFYANKIITTGEGGMVHDERRRARRAAAAAAQPGVRRAAVLPREPGHNFRMTGYQAAMGRVQLAKIERHRRAKRRIAHAYDRALADVAGHPAPRSSATWAKNVYWMYGGRRRRRLRARRATSCVGWLAESGVERARSSAR